MWASDSGRLDVIELLILNGANINHQSLYGATALYKAVEKRDIDAVRLFITNGADVN